MNDEARNEATLKARKRFIEVMSRHIRSIDLVVSDDEMVDAVFARYRRERAAEIVDVSE